MALLESLLQFTGSMGNVSAYRMRGVDKIIIRKKGGATRDQIKNNPEFERTRQQNIEFSGRAQGVHWAMAALRPLKVVADYSLSGPLNKVMKYIQERDTETRVGEKSVQFSKHGSLLEGFSFNRYSNLDTLVTAPIRYALSRETLSAKIDIPELIPALNFFPPKKHQFFCVMAVIGVAPDLYRTTRGRHAYEPSHPGYSRSAHEVTTEWLGTDEVSPATTLEVSLKPTPPANDFALILSVGVCFGLPTPAGKMEFIKHAGSGKIAAVATADQ